jgi:hypothetical protein
MKEEREERKKRKSKKGEERINKPDLPTRKQREDPEIRGGKWISMINWGETWRFAVKLEKDFPSGSMGNSLTLLF